MFIPKVIQGTIRDFGGVKPEVETKLGQVKFPIKEGTSGVVAWQVNSQEFGNHLVIRRVEDIREYYISNVVNLRKGRGHLTEKVNDFRLGDVYKELEQDIIFIVMTVDSDEKLNRLEKDYIRDLASSEWMGYTTVIRDKVDVYPEDSEDSDELTTIEEEERIIQDAAAEAAALRDMEDEFPA